jgi:hypothetical protein
MRALREARDGDASRVKLTGYFRLKKKRPAVQ